MGSSHARGVHARARPRHARVGYGREWPTRKAPFVEGVEQHWGPCGHGCRACGNRRGAWDFPISRRAPDLRPAVADEHVTSSRRRRRGERWRPAPPLLNNRVPTFAFPLSSSAPRESLGGRAPSGSKIGERAQPGYLHNRWDARVGGEGFAAQHEHCRERQHCQREAHERATTSRKTDERRRRDRTDCQARHRDALE